MPDNNQTQSAPTFDNPGVIKLGQEPAAPAPVAAPDKTPASAPPAAGDKPEAKTKPAAEVKPSDVYAMPKEFQHHNRVAGSSTSFVGVLVVAASFIFLVIVGVGFYLYIANPGILSSWTDQLFGVKETPVPDTPVPIATTTEPTQDLTATSSATSTETGELPAMTPQQVYLDYLRDLDNITTFEDYYSLVTQYGSSRRITTVEGQRLAAEATPAADKASVKAIKEQAPKLTGNEDIQVNITQDQAVLNIALANNQATGTINLLLENGAWKINEETWTTAKVAPVEVYTMGADRDGDGLTDAEEDLLGSNKDSTDSDGDGYSDLKEVLNLYNPIGKDKLVDNTRIKSYLADDKSFYFLYPSAWKRVNDNGSPIFMGPDNHFFQLVIADNDRRETLDEYVLRTLGLSQIKDSWRRSADTWSGIISADGLSAYLIGFKKDKFYVFHYNPDDKNILEYPNVFSAMINSFVIK